MKPDRIKCAKVADLKRADHWPGYDAAAAGGAARVRADPPPLPRSAARFDRAPRRSGCPFRPMR